MKSIIICGKTLFVSNLFVCLIKIDFMCLNHFLIFFLPSNFFLIICAETFFYVSHRIDPT